MENIEKETLSGLKEHRSVMYNDGELAIFDNLRDIRAVLRPIQLEICVIILVREGKATATINGITYEARKDDLFICTPNNIVENVLVSLDFEGYCICISSAYMLRLIPFAENSWDIKILFDNNPICNLQPEDVRIFCQYYDLLCSKIQYTSSMQKKIIDTLMIAFIYEMQIVLNSMIQKSSHSCTSRTSIFKRFMDLLSSSYPKQRSVSYYADKLHITSKYLSSICKQVGQQKASDIIDSFVLKDINYLMKHSSKSIKEIACELDFPNLSFFGKYVKKHHGMSPKAYREQALKEKYSQINQASKVLQTSTSTLNTSTNIQGD